MRRITNSKLLNLISPRSLRFQLLSRSLIILAGLLVLIGLLQYVFMRDVIYQNKAESLQSQILSVPRLVWEHFGASSDSNFVGRPLIFMPDASLAFIDTAGNYTVLSEGHDHINPPRLETSDYMAAMQTRWHGVNYSVTSSRGVEQIVVLQPVAAGLGRMVGVVQISTETAPLKELMLRQLLTFFVLALIALLFGLLTYLSVLKKTLVPLAKMVETAEQIDAGNLDRRFPTRQGQAEIDTLADSFNGMLERLQVSFAAEQETKEQMRRFIADASHELRTPLTSIHGFLEVLLRGAAQQPEQLEQALKSMHSESKRLNKLVHDLLLLTKLDRTPRVELKPDYLDRIIYDMEPQLHILAGNRKLSLEITPGMKCNFDTDQMKQVILNLFQNAVQHTDPNQGQIIISLVDFNRGVQLSVQDNGSGISAKHLPRVFERFYRSDASRTRKYGGAGLGLAITKSIIDIHGGTLDVTSQENQGSIFKVWLP